MASKQAVEAFVAQRTVAVVGVSRNERKFGRMAARQLQSSGYRVFPVNPNADEIDGERCYRSLTSLPEPVEAALVVVSRPHTQQVVEDAAHAGIRRIWLQPGSETDEAVRFCEEHGIEVIDGECLLMFANPSSFPHNAHRWIRGLMRRLPK